MKRKKARRRKIYFLYIFIYSDIWKYISDVIGIKANNNTNERSFFYLPSNKFRK